MKTVVIGGGASGMMASYCAAQKGNEVILIEKNEKLGKKVYITGKGRCNVTNNVEVSDFLPNVITNPKFLYSSLYALSPQKLISFFEENGLKLKTERGNRVFPLSDKSSDVIKFFERKLVQHGVDVRLNTTVNGLVAEKGCINKVLTDKGDIKCDSVIICTGGISYPLTGSTGDGYKFAKKLGHSIVEPRPSLCGIELCGEDFKIAQGVSLKNIAISILKNDKKIYSDFGEMLFTHFGVSGPIVLSSSCMLNRLDFSNVVMSIDLKPALSSDTLDNRLIREFVDNSNASLFNVLRKLLPKGLINVVLKKCSISGNKVCSTITQEERNKIKSVLKNLTFDVKKLRPIEEAIVTSGGVKVSEVNPKTMESKIVKNLYFAGEVLDVDAFTGGFNLQIAFSTGFVAGNNC